MKKILFTLLFILIAFVLPETTTAQTDDVYNTIQKTKKRKKNNAFTNLKKIIPEIKTDNVDENNIRTVVCKERTIDSENGKTSIGEFYSPDRKFDYLSFQKVFVKGLKNSSGEEKFLCLNLWFKCPIKVNSNSIVLFKLNDGTIFQTVVSNGSKILI